MKAADFSTAMKGKTFLGHPISLFVLFFTEMWERFNFYLMAGLFGIYLTDYLGYVDKNASDIQTWYLALVYFSPFFGGLIADRLIGYSKAIIAGGLLMSVGAFCLALDRQGSVGHPLMFTALGLLVLGNGLFKPNISTLVGKLYSREDLRRDQAFTIFYMGINVGAALGPIVGGLLRVKYGWSTAFAAGGVGMLLGLVVFIPFLKFFLQLDSHRDQDKPIIPEPDLAKSSPSSAMTHEAERLLLTGQWFNMGGIIAAFFGLILLPLLPWTTWITALASAPAWLTPIAVFFVFWMAVELISIGIFLKARDRQASNAAKLKVLFVIVALFWMAFHQNQVSLTYFARDKVASVDKEMWPANLLTDPEQYQAINPICVVAFSPLMVMLWSFLNRRGMEPSTTVKIGIGMVITALAYVVMVGSGYAGADNGQVGPWWLINCYILLSISELCLSPLGLSITSKLAPEGYKGLWMGFWFVATAVGNKLVHVIGQYWQKTPGMPNTFPPSTLFWILVCSSLGAAVLLAVLMQSLKALDKAAPEETA